MSLLVLMIVGLQARAAEVYVQTSAPGQVMVYGWDGADFGDWPGTALTTDIITEDGYYHFTVPDRASILFHNGSGQQTADIKNLTGDNYFIYPVGEDFTKYQKIEPITSYTVVGDKALMGVDWAVDADANNMVKQGDGSYTLVKEGVTLAKGSYKYKVVGNHDYNVFQLPLDGDNTLVIDKSGEYNVTFTLNNDKTQLTAEAELVKEEVVVYDYYTVAGVAALMGADWSTDKSAGNDMTKLEDGTYKLVKENVELTAGDYEYKVAANHSWNTWNWPGTGNQKLTIEVDGKYNVTFALDITKPELTAVAEKVEDQPVEITSYTIVGDSALVGATWNPELTANDMVLQEDGTYKLVKENVELEAKGYEYKVTANHTWQVWEVPVQGNQTLDIAEAGKYNVTFTLTLGEENVLAAVAEKVEDQPVEITSYTIVGDSALVGAAWNPELTANDMAVQEDGTYKLVKENVELEAKGYEYKVTANHTWQVWEVPVQGNQTLDIAEAGKYNVTFTLTLGEENVLAAVAEKVEEQPVEITSYTIVGDSALVGAAWNPELTENDMVLQEDGTYKLVKENVELEAKGYEYKVVGNRDYNVFQLPLQGNQTLAVEKAGKYNVAFTLKLGEENVLTAVAELIEDQPVEITSYTIVGDSALVGAAWNPELTANDMALQEDGTYKLVKENVELEAKGYEYKVVGNHAWSIWEVPMQGNQTLDIAEAGKYNVTFTLTLGEENVLTAEAQKIEEPLQYLLHYGHGGVNDWQDAPFVAGEGTYEGKLVAKDVEFTADTQFGVKYGDIWYAGMPESTDLYWIHAGWHNNIPLSSEEGIVNFIINEAGTYTFVLTVGEEGITMDVEGFPAPAVVGDVTGDGIVDVEDLNAIVNIILRKAPQTDYPGNANIAGDDDEVDVQDLNQIVNIILRKAVETGAGE